MHRKQTKLDRDIIWAKIDFNTVKNRINEVTNQIEEVIKKYKLSNETGTSGKTNN